MRRLGRFGVAVAAAAATIASVSLLSPPASAIPEPTNEANLCGSQSYRVAADAFIMFMQPVGCAENNAYAFNYDHWYYPSPPMLWGAMFQGSTAWAVGAGYSNTCAVAFAAPEADMAALATQAQSAFGLPVCPFGPTLDDQQNLVHESIGKSGACDATHGWLPSWQEWANAGKGGPVCERTLLYDDSIGNYVVGRWNEAANKYVPWDGATV